MLLKTVLLKDLLLKDALPNPLSFQKLLPENLLLKKLLTHLFDDARSYQIVFLASFLFLGIVTRDWTLQPSIILTAIATCLVIQVGAIFLSYRSSATQSNSIQINIQSHALDRIRYSIPSALITALGLSLLLRVDRASTMMLAASIAIASKFLLQVQGKHLFNPANVGIVAALTLTQDAWVSPGQWGESALYGSLFLGLGGIVLQRVGRWDTSVVFLSAYAGLEAIRHLWLGWTWDVWAHRLTNGSLLLFALFMITDPRTIPNSRTGRFIFAFSIAILTFILRNYFYISTAAFWSLFILSPLTLLLDFIFPSPPFSWTGNASQPTEQEG